MSDYNPELSVLVLDFNKEVETRLCLNSIKKNMLIPHKVILLDNGSAEDYCWKIYKEGLCDILISKKRGGGGGYGQTDLIRFCDTKYFLFVQNDQLLQYPITEGIFIQLASFLNNDYSCVDLNGDQSGRGVWTDRAHMMRTDVFNSLGPFPNGGPGEFHSLRWNENYLQEVFHNRGLKIAHVNPKYFQDLGIYSVRDMGDGGVFVHRTDTKACWVIAPPKIQNKSYPNATLEEFEIMLRGEWPDGKIPEQELAHSFDCWSNTELGKMEKDYIDNLRGRFNKKT
jgi:hypothetical protein